MSKTPAQSNINILNLIFKFKNNSSKFNQLFDNENIQFGNSAREILLETLNYLKSQFSEKYQIDILYPSFTCGSVTQAIEQSGFNPVAYSINRSNFGVSVDEIELCMTKNTRVIIIQNLYGFHYDYSEIKKWAKDNNIIIIHDRAQGALSCFDEHDDFDFVIYSFGRGKLVNALGGGILFNKYTTSKIITSNYNLGLIYLLKVLSINVCSTSLIFKLIDHYLLKKTMMRV